MKKTLYISILLVFASLELAKAQHSAFTIEIPVTVPMGKTADFIDQTGIRGINLEYQRFIKPQFAIGGEIGHTTLYKREENKVYTEGSASLSGIQYRYQYAYPILITGTYFPITEGEIKPYVGVGLGTMAQKRRVDMGIFTSENTHWQFALRPEAGIMIEPSPQVAFKLGVKYYNSFESTDLNGQSNLGINVGLVFLR